MTYLVNIMFLFDEMSCAYPSYNPDIIDVNGNMIPIPCGKCFCCRLDWQKRTINRLYCAWKSYDVSAFVTFTYDDNHLIINKGFRNATLSKDDVHKYLDKIKHQLKNIDFEYYLCGEYGDRFNRPHYHALFFGLDYEYHKTFFENSWKKGTVKVLPCQSNAFKYVTKYMTASTVNNDSQYFDYGILPPFRKMSRGLGMKQFYAHREEIEKQGYFFLDSKKISVNRYYFNKICHYTPNLLLVKENNINDNNRELSQESNSFGLPVQWYKIYKTDQLEKNLISSQLKNNSRY